MTLRISFELDDNDLKHFRLIMHEARQAASRLAPEDIVEAAEDLLGQVPESGAPGFIIERLTRLKLMIAMLSDIEWRLPHQEAKRVLNALAYFAEPEDLIPDHIPGLGFLDDAIMIELVVRELRHEIEAYEDFCVYRERLRDRGDKTPASRAGWLDTRRKELQARMRRRRKRNSRILS
ncbi:MAG: YkvA family protein [Woeseiaceae bacterium]|nr:YkvA family protein [Woeseiaceae bacterium]